MVNKIEKIVKSALAAPTAVNYQPFKIWVLKDEKARAAAAETAVRGETRHDDWLYGNQLG